MISKRIAIVDDEEDLVEVYLMVVAKLGHQMEFVAHDGDEIVQAVMDERIHHDLILMDYRMPTMNGMQAAEQILQVKPDVKIIIATADDLVRRDTDAAGLLFIQKPFSIRALAKIIDEALGS